jgi:glycosyltransferase involved in cell wall biosynthesis
VTRHVLIVAYYFPPIGGIGSIRLASFANYLPEFGWEPIVLAPGSTPHASDPSLSFPNEKVVRSHSIELSRLGGALRRDGGAETVKERGWQETLRRLGHRLVYPDAQIGWYPGAVVAGRRILGRQPVDAVFSSSFPITAHLVARTLSGAARVPWIAEFRDPWSDALPADHPHRRRARALEAAFADRATRVLMPTPTWATHFGTRWGTDVALVPNGCDVGAASPPPPDRPVLTHIGSFYPGRQSLRGLWQGLEDLVESGSVAPRILFVGDLPPEVRAEASAFGFAELVDATGFVPHEEAMQLARASSMLFASGPMATDALARGWVPAKLFEYLGTSLPILYLGDPAGDAGRMLGEYPGCQVVEPGDRDRVSSALQTGLEGRRYDRDTSSLSRRAVAANLAAVLDRAAGARVPAAHSEPGGPSE